MPAEVVTEWKGNSLNFYISPHLSQQTSAYQQKLCLQMKCQWTTWRCTWERWRRAKRIMYIHTHSHRLNSKQGLQDMVTTYWNALRPACFKPRSISRLSQCNSLPGCPTPLHPTDQDIGKMCISKLRKKRVLAKPFFVFLGYSLHVP